MSVSTAALYSLPLIGPCFIGMEVPKIDRVRNICFSRKSHATDRTACGNELYREVSLFRGSPAALKIGELLTSGALAPESFISTASETSS